MLIRRVTWMWVWFWRRPVPVAQCPVLWKDGCDRPAAELCKHQTLHCLNAETCWKEGTLHTVNSQSFHLTILHRLKHDSTAAFSPHRELRRKEKNKDGSVKNDLYRSKICCMFTFRSKVSLQVKRCDIYSASTTFPVKGSFSNMSTYSQQHAMRGSWSNFSKLLCCSRRGWPHFRPTFNVFHESVWPSTICLLLSGFLCNARD